jgi:cyanophycinase
MPRTAPRGTRKATKLKRHPVRSGLQARRPKGRLLIIGGHEDKVNGGVILRVLARAATGGKLVVATLASEQPDAMWDEYQSTLRSLGVRHLYQLKVESRADAESARAMAVLEGAKAVFFTGGDQLRLTATIGDTPVFSRCHEIFTAGGMIAGTSAGAAVMGETMLVNGVAEETPRLDDALHMAPGLGLARDMLIDQHFSERGRIGRLLGAVAQNPRVLGVGIDENTAVDIDALRRFRVIGNGGVYVLDGSDVEYSNVADEERGRTLSIANVRLHVLSQGDEFDLVTRRPKIGPAEAIDAELGVDEKDRKKNGASKANGSKR